MLLCSGCGEENKEGSNFCQACGASLEVQSSLVQVRKVDSGDNKVLLLKSKEERFRRAKLEALKAIKDQEGISSQERSQVVYVGERLL